MDVCQDDIGFDLVKLCDRRIAVGKRKNIHSLIAKRQVHDLLDRGGIIGQKQFRSRHGQVTPSSWDRRAALLMDYILPSKRVKNEPGSSYGRAKAASLPF